jgi:hypothetical protein
VFALNRVVKLSAPGEYRLRSQLSWQGATANSKESSFRMVPLEINSIHLGLGVRPFESGEGEGAFIRRESGGNWLYTFEFREMRPGIGEAILGKPARRVRVSAGATDVAVPWRNTFFFDELLSWIVWREGSTVQAVSSVMESPVSVDLASEPAYLVRPPLKTAGGPVEVLAVSRDRTAVHMVSFFGQPGEPPQAKLAWTARLPAPALTATALLGPESNGSDRHFAFVALRGRGFDIFHARYKQGGALGPFRSAGVESGRPLDSSYPAIFVEPDGAVRVSVIAAHPDDSHSGLVAEALFPADGESPKPPRLVPFEHLPARLVKAAILCVDKQGTLLRQDTVLELDNGELLKLNASGQPTPISVRGTTTTPILLAPGKNTTYIISVEPTEGLCVEHI